MREFWTRAQDLLSNPHVAGGVKAAAILLAGYLVLRLTRRRLRVEGLRAQQSLILRRFLSAVILAVSVAWALSELGLDLRVALGAAGVLTVAVGFAAQTSVSNLISGVFLMAERPFSVGDAIGIGDITGEVLSIDSISVKLRTFDNLLIRIPNETVLKANITNFSHFAIRRQDMFIGVAYGEDIARVRDVLLEVAERDPLCLSEPAPLVLFAGFGDSALQFEFKIWSARENFLTLRNSMHEAVKQAFDEHGIEIPFPQRTLRWAGSPPAGEPGATGSGAPGGAAKKPAT